MAEPAVGEEEKGLPKLTLKEKVLLQIGEQRCESDCAEFPLELTQKGLSECLGARRSHIAASMKGLLDDKLVELHKGHIEGENRQQNAYLLTQKGREKAKNLREMIVGQTVVLDKDGDVGELTIEHALRTTNLSLASIIRQLERGGPLKDERTVVTKPGPQLIQIYCPTCKRNFEVENIYGDEEAGFDCPGCARPYRVVPARKEISEEKHQPAGPTTTSQLAAVVLTVIIALVIVQLRILRPSYLEDFLLIPLLLAIPVILLLGFFSGFRQRKKASRKFVLASGVIATMAFIGFIAVELWNYLIIEVNFQQEAEILAVLAAALALGYIGMPKAIGQVRGEYLLAAGLVMVLIAVTLPFARDIGGLTMASVPFLAVIGVTGLVLSSFHYVDRETQVLDVLLAAGVMTVFISLVELLPERASVLDDLVLASLVLLGAFMISLRFLQPKTTVSVGDQFVYSAALSLGLLFGLLGAFMIWGDSPVAGGAEIVLVSPFLYFGIRKVFGNEWMYRVPIVAYMGFVEVLVLADAFLV